jgi:tRNA A58 N-methylase Trm61
MFQQQAVGSPKSTLHPPAWTGDVTILDWIDSWQAVRDELHQLLAAYAEADDGHDITSFQPLIEQVDASMRLLRHRVGWLRSYLAHSSGLPHDTSAERNK